MARIERITSCARRTSIAQWIFSATGNEPPSDRTQTQKVRVTGYLLWDDERNGKRRCGFNDPLLQQKRVPLPWWCINKSRSLITAVIFLVLAVDYGQAKTTSPLKNATVLIIRHAEKPESGKHLSPAGVRRAQAYVDFFNSFTLNSHLVKVDHLFAAKKSKNSDRPSETLLPLSNALHLKIHSTFDLSESQELADKVRRSYSGETVLICWHHGAIPDLLRAFGAKPKALLPGGEWPDDVFGWLIVLRYDQNGKASANVSNERINPDDAKHPPH
ncbi:MAG TPA: hypothetical protein VEW05_13965 [Candidatus Polarisedimenticolia bacterium]|nr:hypothetical protein [Candidatus Polarisedimenticolia bacterium]